MEEKLVYALLRTTRKLHTAIQLNDPDGYGPAEMDHGCEVLMDWLDEQPAETDLTEEIRDFLFQTILPLMKQ